MANHLSEIKKSISFIFLKGQEDKLVANGTGFFVGVKKEGTADTYSVYFVTAKHVLQDKGGQYYPEIILRLNKLDGNSDLIKVELSETKVFEHTDETVDIALFNCLPDQKIYDFKFIPNELIANNEIIKQHEIAEGDEVFFTGLFTSHIGQKRNQPIIRFGRVALIPEEKIEWKEDGKPTKFMELYLLECQSFGGNSGSPVFFQLNPLRRPGQISIGGPTILLAGIMTGSFLHGTNVQITQAVQNLVSLQNLGIAAVTPANKLQEILFSSELVKARS